MLQALAGQGQQLHLRDHRAAGWMQARSRKASSVELEGPYPNPNSASAALGRSQPYGNGNGCGVGPAQWEPWDPQRCCREPGSPGTGHSRRHRGRGGSPRRDPWDLMRGGLLPRALSLLRPCPTPSPAVYQQVFDWS